MSTSVRSSVRGPRLAQARRGIWATRPQDLPSTPQRPPIRPDSLRVGQVLAFSVMVILLLTIMSFRSCLKPSDPTMPNITVATGHLGGTNPPSVDLANFTTQLSNVRHATCVQQELDGLQNNVNVDDYDLDQNGDEVKNEIFTYSGDGTSPLPNYCYIAGVRKIKLNGGYEKFGITWVTYNPEDDPSTTDNFSFSIVSNTNIYNCHYQQTGNDVIGPEYMIDFVSFHELGHQFSLAYDQEGGECHSTGKCAMHGEVSWHRNSEHFSWYLCNRCENQFKTFLP